MMDVLPREPSAPLAAARERRTSLIPDSWFLIPDSWFLAWFLSRY
jgi:hypothetical protein